MKNDHEPQFAVQLDADAKPEKVDITKQSLKIMCHSPGCFNVRYIHQQDRHQTLYCKPHARIERLRSRAQRARASRAHKNTKKTP